MKRWLTRDSVKAKIGIFAILFLVAGGVGASMHHKGQLNTAVNTTAAAAAPSHTPQATVDVSEKPKISVTETKIETTEEVVPFATTQTYDGTLPKDTTVVRVEGANGKKVVKTEVKTKDGVEISRELISEDVTVPAVAKVVAIGTKIVAKAATDNNTSSCDPHYSPCVKKVGHDIDCKDIGYRVIVLHPGDDPYHLDANGDGFGCENYPALNQ